MASKSISSSLSLIRKPTFHSNFETVKTYECEGSMYFFFKSLHLCLSWSKLLMIWFLCSMMATSSSMCCCSWSRSFWLQSLSSDDGVQHLAKQVTVSQLFASHWPHLGQAPSEVSDLFVIPVHKYVSGQKAKLRSSLLFKKKKSVKSQCLLLREKKNQLSRRVLYTMFKCFKIMFTSRNGPDFRSIIVTIDILARKKWHTDLVYLRDIWARTLHLPVSPLISAASSWEKAWHKMCVKHCNTQETAWVQNKLQWKWKSMAHCSGVIYLQKN